MKLWQIGPEAAASWREIRLEALRLAPRAFGSRYEDWRDVPLSSFKKRLSDARHFAAGEADGRPLAVGCWQEGMVSDDPAQGWVMSVYARPEARGLGYAQAVMARIAEDARAAGMTSLGLHVVTTNHAALRFYARLGYADSGIAGVMSNLGDPEFRLMLDLGPRI
ncbi:GNAT family N-acetyltransferase [Paracoccus aminophilus]|uniref:Acetyltransferase n=1 Tax=Paracoccus aminophilus JCM 7686 TaxID=1367847 RepID=S5XWX7_PARAH|nr:GNAT family N-acetyltransferase [Paracoccus aminophilus]AGT07940.1 acetyltransferase [Paracoccus aminophilus JCM 7686]